MPDISVFCPQRDAAVFRHHFGEISGRGWHYWTLCHDTDVFLTTTGTRIACFVVPYPYNTVIESEIDQIYDHADAVLVLCSEVHPVTVDFMRRFDREKITYFACGRLNSPMKASWVDHFPDWFITTVAVYKNGAASRLFDLNPWDAKPQMFDALLGRKKAHRDQARDFITSQGLAPQCVMTYLDADNMHDAADSDQTWVWEDPGLNDIADARSKSWTVELVEYYGKRVSLSQIMPIDIYNRTAYSLVCETDYSNDSVFVTEKTIKPMLARRLFVLLGNRYALAYLHDMGFRTFGHIIDESYDAMEPVQERHQAALEQMQWLCQQDQHHILSQAREVIDHNFNLLYTRDWYQLFSVPFGRHFFPGIT